MKKTPFRTCPVCGCALDPAERCDCTDEATIPAPQRATAETARLAPPERAYYGAVVGVDLARGRDFTAAPRVVRHGP